MTSNVNLLPTQSPNIKILFKCDISIGSQTRITVVRNRDLSVHYRIKSSKPLLKIEKLTLQKFGKS